MGKTTICECKTPGMVGSKIYMQKTQEGYEARQAIAIFGDFQMKEKDLEKIGYNPFHEDFRDNYVLGKGETEDAAIKDLERDSKSIYESLWF